MVSNDVRYENVQNVNRGPDIIIQENLRLCGLI